MEIRKRLENLKNLHKPKINNIIPRIFISSAMESKDLKLLQKNKITHILIAGKDLKPHFKKKFKYKKLSLTDTQSSSLFDFAIDGIEFIQQALKIPESLILVHCLVGASRSVSIVVGLIMLKFGMSYTQSLEFVRLRRTQARPNLKFAKDLKFFEEVVEIYYIKLHRKVVKKAMDLLEEKEILVRLEEDEDFKLLNEIIIDRGLKSDPGSKLVKNDVFARLYQKNK